MKKPSKAMKRPKAKAQANTRDVDSGGTEYVPSVEILVLPEDLILPTNLQARAMEPDLAELRESLRSLGQIQAIGVRATEVMGKYRVIWGFSRTRAMMDINQERAKQGLAPIKIRATVRSATDEEALWLNISENFQRNALSPVDIAYAIDKLDKLCGYKDAQIAKMFDKTPPWVSIYRTLLSCPREILESVHKGDMAVSAALKFAKSAQTPADQVRLFAEAKERARGQKVTADLAGNVIREMAPHSALPRSMAQLRSWLKAHQIRETTPELADVYRTLLAWLDGTAGSDALERAYAALVCDGCLKHKPATKSRAVGD